MEINKTISPLIEKQFPAIYRDESPLLVAFLKCYYEWAEQDDNFIQLSRSLFEVRDIDTTLAPYGEYFRAKYLSSLPDVFTNQIINNMIQVSGRFMVKHVLDLYKSKGTERGYKILFRSLYNNDVNFYYPGRSLLRASDGIWEVPRYIEIAYDGDLTKFEGHLLQIINKPDNYALCDRVFKLNIGKSYSTIILFLKNIFGNFQYGDIIHPVNNSNILARIVGSLTSIQVTSGGGGFTTGDIVDIISGTGTDGLAVVRSIVNANGGVTFKIVDGGYGYSFNATVSVIGDGTSASFAIGSLTNTQSIQIINDQLINYVNAQLSVFGREQTGTVSTIATQANVVGVGTLFTSEFAVNDVIYIEGEIATKKITSITNNTLLTVNSNFVTTISSNNIIRVDYPLTGTVSTTAGSSNVTGTGTSFTTQFDVGSLIKVGNTVATVQSVTNTTFLNTVNAFSNAMSANVYYADYADYSFPSAVTSREFINTRLKDSFNINTTIIGRIETLTSINPGTNYLTNPTVSVVEPGVLALRISDGAGNYWGNNAIISGTAGNIDGIITSVQVVDSGFGYRQGESVTLFSNLNPSFIGLGITNVGQVGKKQGYWKNTNGFLDNDKYLIDSYYFQEFSYELQTEKDISIWGDIVNGSIHQPGTKMFGKVVISGEYGNSPTVVDNVIEQV